MFKEYNVEMNIIFERIIVIMPLLRHNYPTSPIWAFKIGNVIIKSEDLRIDLQQLNLEVVY